MVESLILSHPLKLDLTLNVLRNASTRANVKVGHDMSRVDTVGSSLKTIVGVGANDSTEEQSVIEFLQSHDSFCETSNEQYS